MAKNTWLQDGPLYDIALHAQKKAIQKHQKKTKRAIKTTRHTSAADSLSARGARTRQKLAPLQQRGRHGEDTAAQFLQAQGLTILERNIHCRTGEIDLIAKDGTSLIFIEVRLRRSRRYGGAAASVNHDKQRRLIQTAQFFLPKLSVRHFAGKTPPCRFDVITIDAQRLLWITHAFDHHVR